MLVGGAIVLLLFGAPLAGWLTGHAQIRFTHLPPIELALRAGPGPASPQADQPRDVVLSALLEDGVYGPVPRIAPDGRRPLVAHARPFDADDPRPRLAVVMVGLGLEDRLTARVIGLPAEISLHFSAYATGLGEWVERARGAGHEVLLDLPMEPLD